MSLADFERAVRERGELGLVDDAYLDRANRETAYGVVHGRDAIRLEWLTDLSELRDARVVVSAELADMVSVIVHASVTGVDDDSDDGDGRRLVAVRFHRWVRREAGRIADEIQLWDDLSLLAQLDRDPDRSARHIAARLPPAPPPLGELRAGRGQLGVGDRAELADEPPAAGRVVADLWHRLWNRRELDLTATLAPTRAATMRQWMIELLIGLPDATMLFDRVEVGGDHVAILWRLFGHHTAPLRDHEATGRRVRLLGSTVVELQGGVIVAEDTVHDETALRCDLLRPMRGSRD